MNLLLILSLHGSLVFILVWALDRALAGKINASGRGGWWLLIPIAYLVSVHLPVPSTSASPLIVQKMTAWSAWTPMAQADVVTAQATQGIAWDESGVLVFWLWIAGVVIYLLAVIIQTRTALRRWSGERLSTDSALLDLLEDCKQEAGITAPIGLVISDLVSAPAILGWLRPRILLPGELISSMSRSELRAVLFHELAHFRSFDIPLNWVFTAARAIHWFNPLAHVAGHAWARFREEAADETAMTWMKESSGATYGQALLHAIKQANGITPAFGALAIGESIHNLKRRIIMITRYQNKSPRLLMAGIVLTLIILGFIVRPIQAEDPASADPKSAAVAAMQTWLHEIDQGQYAQSWTDASTSFQGAIASDGWTAALNGVRTPLGKCKDRKLASALHQTEVPGPTGVQKGDFFVAQFNTSFENLAYAVETVSFEKASDGTWKASGYYIKPKA